MHQPLCYNSLVVSCPVKALPLSRRSISLVVLSRSKQPCQVYVKMTCPIPGPIALPFLGNAHNLDLNNTVQSFMKLAETYGMDLRMLSGLHLIFI